MIRWLHCNCCGCPFVANESTRKPIHCQRDVHGYDGYLYDCPLCWSTRLVLDEDEDQVFTSEYVMIAKKDLFLSNQY